MLDGISLDQLRAFVAAADEGSFSAAARKLNRVQSAVSGWVGSLEARVGVPLFDRTQRYPELTPQGTLLLADARSVISGIDLMKARAKVMAAGVEPELAVVADVFLPSTAITEAAKAFSERFPLTPLRLYVEGLGAAYQPVLDGRCTLGILANLPISFPELVSERLGEIRLVTVAARDHPLAAFGRRRVPRQDLARHIQLVLTDRSELMAGKDFGVVSPLTWRLADLSTKLAFLRDGVGYGSMPLHLVQDDISAGALVVLDIGLTPRTGIVLTMSAVHLASTPPGPAAKWFADYMGARCKPAR